MFCCTHDNGGVRKKDTIIAIAIIITITLKAVAFPMFAVYYIVHLWVLLIGVRILSLV